MEVVEAIQKRRAYRSLERVEITDDMIKEMAIAVQLAPSCFNNQPWRLIFIRSAEMLEKMKPALSKGNEWVYQASLIVVIMSRRQDDCLIGDREYHHFDCGLGAAFLILRATELGLVAHPIAGFSPKKVREILGIPEDYHLHTLIIIGRKSETISPLLSDKQIAWEKERPERLPLDKFVFIDRFLKKE